MKGNKVSLLLLVVVPALLFLSSCGGGGAGGGYTPPGTNSGQPESVQLLPNSFVAQVNGCITLNAQVRDGNGVPVANVPVVFTNQSAPFAATYDSCAAATRTPVTLAITDADGLATVVLSSTLAGFATILAEMNAGGLVTDQKTVYFTPLLSSTFNPTLTLAASSDGVNFNDQSAYTLFKTANDNTRVIQATVTNGILLVAGSKVTFAADLAYRLGDATTCSDGTTTCAVLFPNVPATGDVQITNSSGQAFTTVQVLLSALSSARSVLNITAQADNGAFGMVSLFLEPVVVASVTVSANPQTVAVGGTSTISANAISATGIPVPDGTNVTFTTSGQNDHIVPIGQTTAGVATSIFTASTAATPVTVTATTGGVSGSATITVTAPTPTPTPAPSPTPTPVPIAVAPTTGYTVDCTVGGTSPSYTITGGSPPYTIKVAGNTAGVKITGNPTFVVTVDANSCDSFTPALSVGNNLFSINITDTVPADLANVILTVTDP
ncbi:MAG: hypothetical protein ABSA46_00500 [Thermodesulfovibrionales bacterium]|jgi:hypothetical protein